MGRCRRTAVGWSSDGRWTVVGRSSDGRRTVVRRPSDGRRTAVGRSSDRPTTVPFFPERGSGGGSPQGPGGARGLRGGGSPPDWGGLGGRSPPSKSGGVWGGFAPPARFFLMVKTCFFGIYLFWNLLRSWFISCAWIGYGSLWICS